MALTLRLKDPEQATTAIRNAWPKVAEYLKTGKALILEIRQETRSSRQNRLLHALFNDVSKQAEWAGKKRTPEQWKMLFVSAHAIETQEGAEVVPGIKGEFLNLRESTARMSVSRMNSLIDYVMAWCAENGVELREAEKWR